MRIFTYVSIGILFCLTISCSKSCSNPMKGSLPSSIAAHTLIGKVTSASGDFEGITDYEFSTHFNKAEEFTSKSIMGTKETHGHYSYEKLDKSSAKLLMKPDHDIEQELQIILKFTSSNSGVYEASLLSGGSGEQTGIFDLK